LLGEEERKCEERTKSGISWGGVKRKTKGGHSCEELKERKAEKLGLKRQRENECLIYRWVADHNGERKESEFGLHNKKKRRREKKR